MSKDLEKLRELDKLIHKDYATPAQIERLFNTLVGAVTTIVKGFSKDVAQFKKDKEGATAEMDRKLSGLSNIFQEQINGLDRVTKAELHVALAKAVAEMADEIPEAVDISDLQTRVEEVANLIPDELTGDEIVGRINNGEAKINMNHIAGLPEEIAKLRKDKKFNGGGTVLFGGSLAARDIFADIDLSSQLDGIKKTFQLQAIWSIISVDLTSFPYGSLRKGIDYTYTPTSITFTDTIDAATQLSAGQSCILTAVLS